MKYLKLKVLLNIEKKLSVRQSENLVRLFKNPTKAKSSNRSSDIKDLENTLKDKLGIRVSINNKRNNRGQLTFEYKDLDQLNRLIEIIKANY